MMDIKDRIKLIMDQEELSSVSFAENIGVKQSTLSHILNGRNKPSLDVIMKVHQYYNDVSLDWLLYGRGDMTNQNSDAEYVNDVFTPDTEPSLFDNTSTNAANHTVHDKYVRNEALESHQKSLKSPSIKEIRGIPKQERRITEIRIFFDDNTYQVFKG